MDRRDKTGNLFLPIGQQDVKERRWRELDIIIITGDAYVDHPSFGAAVIGRYLEYHGFKVGIIAQPDWRNTHDFMVLGKPKLFFGITSGNTDSLVANYTAHKRPRKQDDYAPAAQAGLRPDRALLVYANRIRQIYKDIPIVLGGIEASTRRLAHYDYWSDSVRRSVLIDSRADILVYGMGEKASLEIARKLAVGEKIETFDGIRGTAVVRKNVNHINNFCLLPSFEEISKSHKNFNRAFVAAYRQMAPLDSQPVVQPHGDRFLVQYLPALPLTTKELDLVYELPYTRRAHPSYSRRGRIKSLETVKFSLTSHRGCPGECSFCSLFPHQGRIIQSRSEESLLREARIIAALPDFKGTITDIGGPTANLYAARCALWDKGSFCAEKKCLIPGKCQRLKLGYIQSLRIYKKIGEIKGVKHVFIQSGFRYDLLTGDDAAQYLRLVCQYHISGQMKVAPEHLSDNVLALMNKPASAAYEKFTRTFAKVTRSLKKNIFIVNYFIASHPGSSLSDTLQLALYFARHNMYPEQIQDFIPLPMTLSACMYHTGFDPFTGQAVYVPKTHEERRMQRGLLQFRNPANRMLLIKALRKLGAVHLLSTFKNQPHQRKQ